MSVKAVQVLKPKARSTLKNTQAAVYRIRAMEMFNLKIAGKTYVQIGELYECDPETVSTAVDWAARNGLVREHENAVISRLVPKALEVYEKQLASGDPYVAKHVIEQLIKLGDRFESREQQQETLSLRGYLEQKRLEKANNLHGKPVGSGNTSNPASTPAADVPATNPGSHSVLHGPALEPISAHQAYQAGDETVIGALSSEDYLQTELADADDE